MQHLKVLFVVFSCLLASQISGVEAQRRKGALGLGKLFQMAKQFPESCQAECAENELPIQVLVESDADCPDLESGGWSSLSNAVKPWRFCGTEVSIHFQKIVHNHSHIKSPLEYENLSILRIDQESGIQELCQS